MIIHPTPDSDTTLVLRRTFAATRQRVFRAWITPQALEQWLKPRGISITVRSLDARAGGSFCFDMENGNTLLGTYLQFDPPEKLVFTWTGEAISGWETIVTLDFLDHGPMTEVVLTHERLNTLEMRALVAGGWPTMLDTLASILTSQPNL